MSDEIDAKNDTRDLDPVEAPSTSAARPANASLPVVAPPADAPSPGSSPPALPAPLEGVLASPAAPSQPARPWSVPRGRVKILFLAANASAERPLRLDEEYRAVEQRLRATRYRDAFELVSCWALRPDDLRTSLLEHRPAIVHFAGHGDAEADLWLLDERGGKAPLPAEILASIFRAMSDDVRLVVLNACFAAEIADALGESVGLAIGMQSAIGDRAAIEFAGAFYESLGYGCPVREAFDLAVAALKVSAPAQANIPRLLVSPGVDPNAARFVDTSPRARSATDALSSSEALPVDQSATADSPTNRSTQVAIAAAALALAAGLAAAWGISQPGAPPNQAAGGANVGATVAPLNPPSATQSENAGSANALSLEVWATANGSRPGLLVNGMTLASGDTIELSVRTSADAHVYVYFCDEKRTLTRFPETTSFSTKAQEKLAIFKAGEQVFQLDDNVGQEAFYVVASRERADPKVSGAVARARKGAAELECSKQVELAVVGQNSPAAPPPPTKPGLPDLTRGGKVVQVGASDSVVASSNEDGLVVLRYGFLHKLRGACPSRAAARARRRASRAGVRRPRERRSELPERPAATLVRRRLCSAMRSRRAPQASDTR